MTGKRLAGFIVALGLSGSASAAPVTWAFEGYVTDGAAEPDTTIVLSSLGVAIGSTFFGRLVFESETPDEDADPAVGWYPGTISLFEVTIGGYHAAVSSGDDNGMTVSVYEFAHPYGVVRARASTCCVLSLLSSPLIELLLPGSPASPLYGDELSVLFPPGLVEYDYDELFIAGIDGNIFGNVTSIELVPEPAMFALLAPFALAFSALRRR